MSGTVGAATSPLKVALITGGSVLAAAAAAAGIYVVGFSGDADPSGPGGVTPTVTATAATDGSSASGWDVVPRGVTDATFAPAAYELDGPTLSAVSSGWVLSMFDTGSYDAAHNAWPDVRIMYLISPDGTPYEAGSFDATRQADVIAWNIDEEKALLSVDEFGLAVFDIANNSLGATWMPCGTHALDIRVQPRSDGNWSVRGACAGAQLDGIYSDTGALVADPAFIPTSFGTWSTDINGGVVLYDYDLENFIATAPGVTDPTILQEPAGMDSCRPLANGRGLTVSVECIDGVQVSAWELDSTGGVPTLVAPWGQIDYFANGESGLGAMGDTQILKSCVVGSWEVLKVASPAGAGGAGFAAGPNMTRVDLSPSVWAQDCWGSSGSVGLFSGSGNLWLYTAGVGTTVPLIQVAAPSDEGGPIGVELTRSIITP